MLLDTDFLKTEEISLRQIELEKDDPQRKWDPAFHFDILDRTGAQVGGCNLRLGHSGALYYAGNIGYRIDEPYRGRHYAGKACRLLFQLAKRHGMEYVIITCGLDNHPSRKTCEWLGGELLEIAELPEESEQRRLTGDAHRCVFRFSL
ncbi:MAG: GNAT family N-acetyltransferase [Oscillospiraceae bacterium]|nr:GNAT family N-acetyltransferase [Oscillospiraceae bacterium]